MPMGKRMGDGRRYEKSRRYGARLARMNSRKDIFAMSLREIFLAAAIRKGAWKRQGANP